MARLSIAVVLAWALLGGAAWPWEADKDARLRRELGVRDFAGVVLVAEGDVVVFREAFGYRDFDAEAPASPDTAYEVGSVSKPFTATAVLMLEERGALSLDDPITKYLPELPYDDVTLGRMLSHTSGLYDVCCQPDLRPRFDEFYGKSDPPYSNGDYLAFVVEKTPALLAPPGETYRYSNFAYVLLALVVEQVSGTEFDVFLKENVFDALGLDRTFVLSLMDDPAIESFAVGYRPDDDGMLVVDVPVPTPERTSVFAATYGDDELVSTVDDLFTFGRALHQGELLRPETVARAYTPARLANGEPGPYGLGFRVGETPDGRTLVFHTGSTNGFLATCTFPTDANEVTVVLLSNVVRDDFADVRTAVFEIVWGSV